jgi:hypothetical protein
MPRDDELHALTESLIYELVKAFALPQTKLNRFIARAIFGNAVRAIAQTGIGLDRVVAQSGLNGGARWLLPKFVKSHQAYGVDNIPASGPLVIASNHPANVDTMVIAAHVERPDFKVFAGDIPFFKNLPNTSRYAIYIPPNENTAGRMRALRESIRHLNNGGALLIFPRGLIEADPAFMPNPEGEFNLWSRSLEIFLQRVPQLQILITMVSGVISQSAMRHPITWLRRERRDRQRLAFIYQLLRQMVGGDEIFGLTPRVMFGELITGNHHEHPLAKIEQAARRTLKHHLEWSNT